MDQDDQELLSAMGRGDHGAFAHLYLRYKDELLTTVVCLLSGDRSEAEDVVHDVFVALARKASELKVRTSLHGYLVTACLNRVRDILRRRARTGSQEKDPDRQQSNAPAVPQLVSVAEETQRALAALASLSAEQREVVTLKIHGQLTFRDIADVLGISINTAQSRYRYALSRMRSQLTNDGPEPQGE